MHTYIHTCIPQRCHPCEGPIVNMDNTLVVKPTLHTCFNRMCFLMHLKATLRATARRRQRGIHPGHALHLRDAPTAHAKLCWRTSDTRRMCAEDGEDEKRSCRGLYSLLMPQQSLERCVCACVTVCMYIYIIQSVERACARDDQSQTKCAKCKHHHSGQPQVEISNDTQGNTDDAYDSE